MILNIDNDKGIFPININNSNVILKYSTLKKYNTTTNHTDIRSNNSKLTIISGNCLCQNKETYTLKLINNSKCYIEDYNLSDCNIKNLSNSIANLPEISNISLTKDNKNTITYTYLDSNSNAITSSISNMKVFKILKNDGNIFSYYGNNINDYILPYKIKSYNILCTNIDTFLNLLNNYITKDLHQAKLNINFNNISKNICISGFYNGIILITNNNFNLENNAQLKFLNCENILFNNISVLLLSSNNIYFKNIKSCDIHNSYFYYKNNISTTINNLNTLTYKTVLIPSNLKNINLSGNIIFAENSNIILRNNIFNNFDDTTIYNPLVYCLAYKNSNIASYNNTFNYKIGQNNKRCILFYSAANSKIDSYKLKVCTKDTQIYTYNLSYNGNELINLAVNNSPLYGFALPGSIFNHNHSDELLTEKQVEKKNNILHTLPIGSIHGIYSLCLNKYTLFNTVKGCEYSNQLIGYISACDNMKAYLTNTNNSNTSILVELNSNVDNINAYEVTKSSSWDYLFPYITEWDRYKSMYSENLYYFKKYYLMDTSKTIMVADTTEVLSGKSFDDIKNYFIDNIDNINLSCNMYNSFFRNTDNEEILIKYSLYTHYKKQNLLTNKNNKIRSTIGDS